MCIRDRCSTGFLGVVNSKIASKYVIYDYRQDWAEADLKETAGFKEQGFWNPHNKIPGYYYCIDLADFSTHNGNYFFGEVPAANWPDNMGSESRIVTNAHYGTSTKSFIQHCSSLIENNLKFGCRTCKWGYRGLFVHSTEHDLNFMGTCTEITDCDTTTIYTCLLYTSPSPRDRTRSRMPSSA